GRGEPIKSRTPPQAKPLSPQPVARIPDAPKFVPKSVGRRGNFGRPDRLNLAEVEDELVDEEDPEDNEDVEEEEDEAINDALHPRPRPLRADA
ncbi:Protein of unknown function, partial [Gryllus bimaculatus]